MILGYKNQALKAAHYCHDVKQVCLFGEIVVSVTGASQEHQQSELVLQRFAFKSPLVAELKPVQTIPMGCEVTYLDLLLCNPSKCLGLILTLKDGWKEAVIFRSNAPSASSQALNEPSSNSNNDDSEDNSETDEATAPSPSFSLRIQREVRECPANPMSCRWSRNGAEYVIVFADGSVLLRSYVQQHDIALFRPYQDLPMEPSSKITAADLSPDGSYLATLFPSGNRATFWRTSEPEMVSIGELDTSLIRGGVGFAAYLGRFSRVEGLSHCYRFIAVHIPVATSSLSCPTKKNHGSKSQSYLVVWELEDSLQDSSPQPPAPVTATRLAESRPVHVSKLPKLRCGTYTSLAVSQGGRYVAVGDAEGSVLVFNAYNLRKVHSLKGSNTQRGHKAPITELHFLPQKTTDRHENEFELVSFSASNGHLLWHAATPHNSLSFALVVVAVLLGICLFFYFFSMLGL